MAHLAGFQHLLDGAKESIGVIEHNAIKVATLGFVELPAFESLQVQANGSDGRLKFVCHYIEKAILLLISADFADEKDGVDQQPAMMSPKKMTPSTRGTTRRQLRTIQVTLSTTVNAIKQAPSVMKNAIAFVRLVMRMRTTAQIIVKKRVIKQILRAVALAISTSSFDH
jgi:hypothetical protein